MLCKAKHDDLKAFMLPMLRKYFTLSGPETADEEQKVPDQSKYLTWCMEFKNKNNNNVKKQEVLDFIFKTVDGRTNPVDLKNADLNVIVEVYRDILMMGVVPRYKELKKFNLQQLTKGEDSEDEPLKVVKVSDLLGKREAGPTIEE